MEKPAYRKATKEMLDVVTRVFVRSASLQRAVVELGCEENKIDIVRTGIPLNEFPFREREFPTNGEWRLVQASRLIEKKGLATTLHSFTTFLSHYPNATLTIAGEGPMLRELEELTCKLKIDDRVALPGFVTSEKLREIYYASHIFLHPSETGSDGNQEGVPNSLLEAMSSGLPVFATRHGGIPEAVESNVSGILVNERDHRALADVLIECAKDPARLAATRGAASESVAKNFNQTDQTRQLEEIYLREIAAN